MNGGSTAPEGWEQVWSAEEMAEIMTDYYRIMSDLTLRVNTNAVQTRGIGHWERMRIQQAQDIMSGSIYAKDF